MAARPDPCYGGARNAGLLTGCAPQYRCSARFLAQSSRACTPCKRYPFLRPGHAIRDAGGLARRKKLQANARRTARMIHHNNISITPARQRQTTTTWATSRSPEVQTEPTQSQRSARRLLSGFLTSMKYPPNGYRPFEPRSPALSGGCRKPSSSANPEPRRAASPTGPGFRRPAASDTPHRADCS